MTEEKGSDEEWRVKAERQIDSLARVFRAIALLAILGLVWISLHSLFLDDVYPIPGDYGILMTGDGMAICVFVTIVLSALGAVLVQRKLQTNVVAADDDDCKQSKVNRKEQGRRHLLALFLSFLAVLSALQVIWASMSIPQDEETMSELLTVRNPDMMILDSRAHVVKMEVDDDDDDGHGIESFESEQVRNHALRGNLAKVESS